MGENEDECEMDYTCGYGYGQRWPCGFGGEFPPVRFERGMDGILFVGKPSGVFAVPREEKRLLIREAVSYINRRVTVYVGTNEMEFPA